MTHKQIENLVAISVLFRPVIRTSGNYAMEKMARVVIPRPTVPTDGRLSPPAIGIRSAWMSTWARDSVPHLKPHSAICRESSLPVDLQKSLMDFLFEVEARAGHHAFISTGVFLDNQTESSGLYHLGTLVDMFSRLVGDPAEVMDPDGDLGLHPYLRDFVSKYMDRFRREVNILLLDSKIEHN